MIIISMLAEKVLSAKAAAAISAPAIATARQPYLFINAPTIGPAKCIDRNMKIRDKKWPECDYYDLRLHYNYIIHSVNYQIHSHIPSL